LGAKGEAIDLEAKIELVSRNVACADLLGLDEATVETEIEYAAFAQIPTLNAKIDGTVAGVTNGPAAVRSG
jgi:hypothetical protein